MKRMNIGWHKWMLLTFMAFFANSSLFAQTVTFEIDGSGANDYEGCEDYFLEFKANVSGGTVDSIQVWNSTITERIVKHTDWNNPGPPNWSHTVALTEGTYNPVLRVLFDDGTVRDYTLPSPINVFANPTADFDIDAITDTSQCFAENEFWFNDQSTKGDPNNEITGWTWDFGDGATSKDQNPKYSYQFAGHYRVVLTVTDEKGCSDAKVRDDYPLVYEDMGVDFRVRGPVGCPCTDITFTNRTALDISQVDFWIWDWGTGRKSQDTFYSSNPDHVDTAWTGFERQYCKDGYSSPKLVVLGKDGCRDSMILTDAIRAVNFNFDIFWTPDTPCFQDNSIRFNMPPRPNATQWLWTFGDPLSMNLNFNNEAWDPSHTYVGGPGFYHVNLAILEPPCPVRDTTVCFVKLKGPQASIDGANPNACLDPREIPRKDFERLKYDECFRLAYDPAVWPFGGARGQIAMTYIKDTMIGFDSLFAYCNADTAINWQGGDSVIIDTAVSANGMGNPICVSDGTATWDSLYILEAPDPGVNGNWRVRHRRWMDTIFDPEPRVRARPLGWNANTDSIPVLDSALVWGVNNITRDYYVKIDTYDIEDPIALNGSDEARYFRLNGNRVFFDRGPIGSLGSSSGEVVVFDTTWFDARDTTQAATWRYLDGAAIKDVKVFNQTYYVKARVKGREVIDTTTRFNPQTLMFDTIITKECDMVDTVIEKTLQQRYVKVEVVEDQDTVDVWYSNEWADISNNGDTLFYSTFGEKLKAYGRFHVYHPYIRTHEVWHDGRLHLWRGGTSFETVFPIDTLINGSFKRRLRRGTYFVPMYRGQTGPECDGDPMTFPDWDFRTVHDSNKFKFDCQAPNWVQFTNNTIKYRMNGKGESQIAPHPLANPDNVPSSTLVPNVFGPGLAVADSCANAPNWPFATDSIDYFWDFGDNSDECTTYYDAQLGRIAVRGEYESGDSLQCQYSELVAPLHLFVEDGCWSVTLTAYDHITDCEATDQMQIIMEEPDAGPADPKGPAAGVEDVNYYNQIVFQQDEEDQDYRQGMRLGDGAPPCVGNDINPYFQNIDIGGTLPSCGRETFWMIFNRDNDCQLIQCNDIELVIDHRGSEHNRGIFPVYFEPEDGWSYIDDTMYGEAIIKDGKLQNLYVTDKGDGYRAGIRNNLKFFDDRPWRKDSTELGYREGYCADPIVAYTTIADTVRLSIENRGSNFREGVYNIRFLNLDSMTGFNNDTTEATWMISRWSGATNQVETTFVTSDVAAGQAYVNSLGFVDSIVVTKRGEGYPSGSESFLAFNDSTKLDLDLTPGLYDVRVINDSMSNFNSDSTEADWMKVRFDTTLMRLDTTYVRITISEGTIRIRNNGTIGPVNITKDGSGYPGAPYGYEGYLSFDEKPWLFGKYRINRTARTVTNPGRRDDDNCVDEPRVDTVKRNKYIVFNTTKEFISEPIQARYNYNVRATGSYYECNWLDEMTLMMIGMRWSYPEPGCKTPGVVVKAGDCFDTFFYENYRYFLDANGSFAINPNPNSQEIEERELRAGADLENVRDFIVNDSNAQVFTHRRAEFNRNAYRTWKNSGSTKTYEAWMQDKNGVVIDTLPGLLPLTSIMSITDYRRNDPIAPWEDSVCDAADSLTLFITSFQHRFDQCGEPGNFKLDPLNDVYIDTFDKFKLNEFKDFNTADTSKFFESEKLGLGIESRDLQVPFDTSLTNLYDTTHFTFREPGKYLIGTSAKAEHGVEPCFGGASKEVWVGQLQCFRQDDDVICENDSINFVDSIYYWDPTIICQIIGWFENTTCIDTASYFYDPLTANWQETPDGIETNERADCYDKSDNFPAVNPWERNKYYQGRLYTEMVAWDFNAPRYRTNAAGDTLTDRFGNPIRMEDYMRVMDTSLIDTFIDPVKTPEQHNWQRASAFGVGNPRTTTWFYGEGDFGIGVYDVTLWARDSLGNWMPATRKNAVRVVGVESRFSLCDTCRDTLVCTPSATIFKDSSVIFENKEDNPLGYAFRKGKEDSVISWNWDFGDGTDSSLLTNPIHTYLRPNDSGYDTRLIVRTAQGCIDTTILEQHVKIVGPDARFSLLTDSICVDDSIYVLDSSFSYDQNAELTRVWNKFDSTGTLYGTQNSKGRSPVGLYFGRAGEYTISLIVAEDVRDPVTGVIKDCSDEYPNPDDPRETAIKINVRGYDELSIFADDTLICPGETVQFTWDTAASYEGYDSLYWTLGVGNDTLERASGETVDQLYAESGEYKIWLGGSGPQPICPTDDTAKITVKEVEAVVEIAEDASNEDLGNYVFENLSVNGVWFEWRVFALPDDQNPIAVFERTDMSQLEYNGFTNGDYRIILTASDLNPEGQGNPCYDYDTVEINVTPNFEIGNTFTPNDDGNNDMFSIKLAAAPEYELVIYNRWGERMYRGNQDDAINCVDEGEQRVCDFWDGLNQNTGARAPAGTYFYIFKYRFKGDDVMEEVNGTVTLIR